MQPFRTHKGKVVPLDRANIDTDQIIPKQFLKTNRAHRLRRIPLLRLAPHQGRFAGPVVYPEPATLQGCQHPRDRQEFRLRIIPRTRRLGPGRFRLPRGDCSIVRRHLRQQLRKEWRAHSSSDRKRSRRNYQTRAATNRTISYPLTSKNTRSRMTLASKPPSRSTNSPATACWKASTTSA